MASRAPSHTEKEWETIKPKFTKLYINQKKKLPQVIRTLEACGFFASKKQYKSKIKEWGLCKNLKERELLHAARKLTQARSRGRPVEVKLRDRVVTMDDVMKHFGRKSIYHEDDLIPILPASPTPSIIDCHTIADLEDELQTLHPAGFDDQRTFLKPVTLPIDLGVTPFERGLSAMRTLAQGSAHHLCPLRQLMSRFSSQPQTNLQVWRTPCQIVKNLHRTQYYLNAGLNAKACTLYSDALDGAMQSTNLSCTSILQLILQLFTWSLYDNTAPLSKGFLRYLARVDSLMAHQCLIAVAKTLHDSHTAESYCRIVYQRIVCDVFEEWFGQQSPILFWARIRLCRQLFFTDQAEEAWSVWKLIEDRRASRGHLLTPGLRYEMDREMGATLHLFGNFRVAKQYLEGVLNYYLNRDGEYRSRLAHTLQQLAACNAQLGLHVIAHIQAKEAAAIFASFHEEHDNLVLLSSHFASQIEISSMRSNMSSVSQQRTHPERVSGFVLCPNLHTDSESEHSEHVTAASQRQQIFFMVCDAGGGTVDITSYPAYSSLSEHGLFRQAAAPSDYDSESTLGSPSDTALELGNFDLYPGEQILSLPFDPGVDTYQTLKTLSTLLTID